MQETIKCLDVAVKVSLVMLHVVRLNIGNQRHHGLQMQERSVALVRFHHQILPFTQCRVGDLLRVRFDFNVTPQQANTTLEVCLIWATRNENDEVTFTFPLTAQPIFFGTGTVGRTMLNRVELSAYFASDEDINARALPAIKADNEILIAPLTMLTSITR